jgi:xanthine/uracil permease
MLANPEWFRLEQGFTGKVHFIPTKAAGWLYCLCAIIAIFLAQVLFAPLVVGVMIFLVVDMIHMGIQQNRGY